MTKPLPPGLELEAARGLLQDELAGFDPDHANRVAVRSLVATATAVLRVVERAMVATADRGTASGDKYVALFAELLRLRASGAHRG